MSKQSHRIHTYTDNPDDINTRIELVRVDYDDLPSEIIAYGYRTSGRYLVMNSAIVSLDFDLDEKIQLVHDLRLTSRTPYFSAYDKTRWELMADCLEFAIYFLEEN